MRNTGGCALIAASGVLLVGAIAVNSTALFLMATALGVMILTCRLQAWLAVRGLRLERECPSVANAGDMVTVRIGVLSDYGFKRPLVTVVDDLPAEMEARNVSPSLPVAPSSDFPVFTQYRFEATRRGRFRLRSMTVSGSDALGLVQMSRRYESAPSEILVLPAPIPFDVRLPHAAGWGVSESDFGRSRGQGIEPRGVREYAEGDSERHIHWRSSARTGQLMVKEFETGSVARACLFLQTPERADRALLDRMCGHAAFLCDRLLAHGAEVAMPGRLEGVVAGLAQRQRLLEALADLEPGQSGALGGQLAFASPLIPPGSTVYLFLAQPDPALPGEVRRLSSAGTKCHAIVYGRAEGQFVVALQSAGATVQFEVLP